MVNVIPYRKKTDIVRDPIYNYIDFTKPFDHNQKCERDIIDTQPFQRLRQIHQLQSAWMVYPGAEHTRFQHSLGTMHLCGLFSQQLYKPYLSVIGSSVQLPELNEIIEELRLAGLLHDIGHGPFGHLLDETYMLPNFGITHEDISQEIIQKEFEDVILKINRSPYGNISSELDVEIIKNMIKHQNEENFEDNYMKSLYRILHGIWSADTMDFIQRDAYYCGTKEYGIIDYERLINSSIMPENGGLALYKTSLPALQAFLISRIFMFTSVYFHRTARAFDISVRRLLPETFDNLEINNPIEEEDSYQKYLETSEFSLFQKVKKWTHGTDSEKKKLGESWTKILQRDIEWRHAYSETITPIGILGSTVDLSKEDIMKKVKPLLPSDIDSDSIEIDIPAIDVKSPFKLKDKDYAIYDPDEEDVVDQKGVNKFLIDLLPKKIVYFSIYSKKDQRNRIHEALKKSSINGNSFSQETNF